MMQRPGSSTVKEEFFSADTDCIVESIKSSERLGENSSMGKSRTPKLEMNANEELTFEKQVPNNLRAGQAVAERSAEKNLAK